MVKIQPLHFKKMEEFVNKFEEEFKAFFESEDEN